jgi:hypothetical protein
MPKDKTEKKDRKKKGVQDEVEDADVEMVPVDETKVINQLIHATSANTYFSVAQKSKERKRRDRNTSGRSVSSGTPFGTKKTVKKAT